MTPSSPLASAGSAACPRWGRRGSPCYDGVGRQLYRAGLSLANLRSIFIPHLHSDQAIDYINLMLYGWYQDVEKAPRPIEVYGPGDRGKLPPVWGNAKRQGWRTREIPPRARWTSPIT